MNTPLDVPGRPLFFKIGNLVQETLAAQARHGQRIRTFARSLSVMQKEAIVISGQAGIAWRLASDEGPYLKGDDVAPCPLAFMTAGMIASYMTGILRLAEERGLHLRRVRLVQDNFYAMSGSALRGTMIGGALPVTLTAEVDCSADAPNLNNLLNDAVAASPASALMRDELTSRFTLTHNGRQIETGRVDPIDKSAEPDPAAGFDTAQPEDGDWNNLVLKGPMTPRTMETTSAVGSSLAEEQNRRLHLRGICSLQPDGLKKIEVQLHNPQGSIFYFLSDETVEANGGSRAPDAATYISAAIAFCFMTQFGRYATIMKKDLREYRIVQDTHFSQSGDGRFGEADAVETHVHLVSGEDDSFARTILDMSEQTCFLHALCRTSLTPDVGILKTEQA